LVTGCVYCLNCTKFGQLILRKIIKIVATRCQILRLKCTKFDFGWGSALPQTPLGELTALFQIPYLDLMGPTSKEREMREGKGRAEGGEKRKGGRNLKGCSPPPKKKPPDQLRPCRSAIVMKNQLTASCCGFRDFSLSLLVVTTCIIVFVVTVFHFHYIYLRAAPAACTCPVVVDSLYCTLVD